jgi:ribosomal protein S18 acetylase RimI-like enzyme
MSYLVRPLDAVTWDAFAELVERNNGIFGGCWCIGYHPECGQKGISHRAVKEDRVRAGRAHAALVLDQHGAAQGWCQYGSPGELPGIKHKREYEKDAPPRPDWRITCFYGDQEHRGRGIARAALEGALNQIAQAGGGLVEAISEVTTGREAQGRFLPTCRRSHPRQETAGRRDTDCPGGRPPSDPRGSRDDEPRAGVVGRHGAA